MFVALVPPADAVDHLGAFLEPRREAAALRWVGDEQFHVTLAFAEAVAERKLDEVIERLARAAARRTGFDAAITGGGAFPDVARGRVLWTGLALADADREELSRLATGARAAMAKSGVAVDGQRFRPHLTLARVGLPMEMTNWVRLLDTYRGPTWRADRIALIASHLGEGPRGRPRYECVAEFELS